MARYNRFGCLYTDIVSMFPGAVLADFGTAAAINLVIDRVTLDVAAALAPNVYEQMTRVDAELAVDFAASGQTAFNLGLFPVVAGSVHLFRYPSLAALEYETVYGDWINRKPVIGGFGEVPTTGYTVNATTGAIALIGGASLILNERVFASYRVDEDNAAFAMPSMAAIIQYGVAAEMGAQLYSNASQQWALVQEYAKRYNGQFVAGNGGIQTRAFAGTWVPDELRKLRYWQDVERASSNIGSVRTYRG